MKGPLKHGQCHKLLFFCVPRHVPDQSMQTMLGMGSLRQINSWINGNHFVVPDL